MKSIGQILGMMDSKLSQEIDGNDSITAGAVADFIHMETMCQILGLKFIAEDARYTINHLCTN